MKYADKSTFQPKKKKKRKKQIFKMPVGFFWSKSMVYLLTLGSCLHFALIQ